MHPPHKLADGSAVIHADDCERCFLILGRWLDAVSIERVGICTIPRADFQRIDAQLDAEDAQEAANKEAK